MGKLKMRRIGNSLGVLLPREMASRPKVAEGYDPDFEKKLEAARRVTRRYRNALKELAK